MGPIGFFEMRPASRIGMFVCVVNLPHSAKCQQPPFPSSPNPEGTAQTARLGIQTFKERGGV
jgi:hypothetical protein